MRFADELRGSEGERCLVIDVTMDELLRPGVIVRWDDATKKAEVKLDDGNMTRVSYQLVRLTGVEML